MKVNVTTDRLSKAGFVWKKCAPTPESVEVEAEVVEATCGTHYEEQHCGTGIHIKGCSDRLCGGCSPQPIDQEEVVIEDTYDRETGKLLKRTANGVDITPLTS